MEIAISSSGPDKSRTQMFCNDLEQPHVTREWKEAGLHMQ